MTEQTPRDGLDARQSDPQARDGESEGRGDERAADGREGLRERITRAMTHVLALDRHLLKPEELRIIGELTDAVLAELTRELDEPPAHNAGPTVAECTEADRAYWERKDAGEGQ